MTSLISVVTAVHPPSIPYLAEAYASLAEQRMPAGWDWEWLVQEDGQTGALGESLPDDDTRIHAGASRRGGAAITRNMALSRARGRLVRVLDADDRLTPGALSRDIAVLTARPAVGWTTSRVLDLLPDGSTVGWEHADPPDGVLTGEAILRYFEQNSYRLPVHPATLCIRRNLALALGGWMALPAGEDTALLLAAAAVCDGYFIHEPGLLYRKHQAQITSDEAWTEPVEWTARMQLIQARTRALGDLWSRERLAPIRGDGWL